MKDNIAKIHDHPAVAGESLLFAFFLEFGTNIFNDRLCESIDHAVTGAGTDDEIVGK